MKENYTHLQLFIEEIVKDTVETVLTQNQQLNSEFQVEKKDADTIEILNSDQAAEFLHLAKQTLYTFTHKRKIPFYKNGKKVLFKKHELQEWLDSGRQYQSDDSNKPKLAIRINRRAL